MREGGLNFPKQQLVKERSWTVSSGSDNRRLTSRPAKSKLVDGNRLEMLERFLFDFEMVVSEQNQIKQTRKQ